MRIGIIRSYQIYLYFESLESHHSYQAIFCKEPVSD